MKTHYIVLNGKRYDATTGALIDSVIPINLETPVKQNIQVKNIDSILPNQKPDIKRPSPIEIEPHKPQKSHTLARRAVKPEPEKTLAAIKKQYPIQKNNSTNTTIAKKTSVDSVSTARLKRAKLTPKSIKIGHFSAQPITPIRPQIVPVQVAQAPSIHTQKHAKQTNNLHLAPKKPNIFEEALANAKSHENVYASPKLKKSSKKSFVSFGFVAIVACTTLLGLSYRQSLEAQVASVRAGFAVSKPTFVPSGFKQQTTAVEGKSVSINYISPLDRTKYSLTQESSGWNSSDVLASVAAKSGNSYRVILNDGKTIFLYDHNKATWVDNGILYTINGNAPLTADQITSIASSL